MSNSPATENILTSWGLGWLTAAQAQDRAEGYRPRPASTRYELLDVFRGIACLLLVLYHATFYAEYSFRLTQPASWTWAGLPLYIVSQSWIGVPIFFVISGYCIAASIDNLRRRPHSFVDYFWRRFRRIYPPLWCMCLIAVVFTCCLQIYPEVTRHCAQLPRLNEFTWANWLGNVTATEGWNYHLTGGSKRYLMLTIWTLCYEEQFYLVTGVLLALVPRFLFRATGIVTGVILVLRHYGRARGWHMEGFFWDGHWLIFAAGMLVYQAVNLATVRERWTAAALLACGTVYGVIDRFAANNPWEIDLSKHLCVGCLFALLLIGLHRWETSIARHRWLAPLRFCGQRSYSIYLTHYLFVVVLASALAQQGWDTDLEVALGTVPLSLFVALPFACLFYELVEKRCLNAPAETKPSLASTSAHA